MGFRFHRSIKILPGVRINMSKNHPVSSITIGGRKSLFKSNVPVGRSGPATSTVGNLGGLLTGLSYTHHWKGAGRKPQTHTPGTVPDFETPSFRQIGKVIAIPAALLVVIVQINESFKGDKVPPPKVQESAQVAPAPAPVEVPLVVQQCRDIILRPGYTVDPESVVFEEPRVEGDPAIQFTVTQRYSEESFGGRRVVDQTCNGSGGTVQSYSGQLVN